MKKKWILVMALVLVLVGTSFSWAETLDTVKKNGYITIAVAAGSPPFSFVDAQTTKDTGFDVEYAKEVANHLGVKSKILMVEWAGILPGLLAGKYDMIIGSMAITESRQKQASFSKSYYVSGAQLVIKKDNTEITSLDDCKNKRIGVTIGTTYEEKAKEVPGVTVVTYKTEVDQLMDLINGNIDAVITDKYIGAYTIKESNLPLKLAGGLIYEEILGIPVRKQDPKLLEELNKAVETITNDGTFDRLAIKWFGI